MNERRQLVNVDIANTIDIILLFIFRSDESDGLDVNFFLGHAILFVSLRFKIDSTSPGRRFFRKVRFSIARIKRNERRRRDVKIDGPAFLIFF